MNLKDMCEALAGEIAAGRYRIRDTLTGHELHTPEEIFNYSSTGELYKIWEWYYCCFPERLPNPWRRDMGLPLKTDPTGGDSR